MTNDEYIVHTWRCELLPNLRSQYYPNPPRGSLVPVRGTQKGYVSPVWVTVVFAAILFPIDLVSSIDQPTMAVTYTFCQGDLRKLDLQVDRGSDFAAWKLQWDSYRSLSGLAEQGAATQVQALTLCFSRDTLSVV